MKYSEIRKFTPRKASHSLIDALCITISPFFTSIFVRHNIVPNKITLLMILLGIIGTVLLLLPFIALKCIGILFLLFWYVMDCCDGEVARITQKFSKYGIEMDYVAHLICHPLFVIAVWCNFYQLDKYNLNIISFLSLLLISNELIHRNFLSFDTYLNNKKAMIFSGISPTIRGSQIQKMKYVVSQLLVFPNIVVFFPLILVLDFCGLINSYYVFFFYCVYKCTCWNEKYNKKAHVIL